MVDNKYPLIYDDSTVSPTGQHIAQPLPAWTKNTPVNEANLNKFRDSILQIEKTLGIVPQGTYSTVRDRLDAMIAGSGGSSAGVVDVILTWSTSSNIPSAGLIVYESTQTIGMFAETIAVAETATASSGGAEVKGIATVSNYIRVAGIADVICALPVNINDKLFLSPDPGYRGYATPSPPVIDNYYVVYIGSALTASDPVTGICKVLLNIQRPIYLTGPSISLGPSGPSGPILT